MLLFRWARVVCRTTAETISNGASKKRIFPKNIFLLIDHCSMFGSFASHLETPMMHQSTKQGGAPQEEARGQT
jgi:hypothetical protein